MAKQFSPNSIRPTDDWAIDTRNNLPYSGQAIQNYIKSGLAQSVGAAYFNQSNFTLYFFNSTADRDTFAADNTRTDLIVSSTALNLSSDMYRVLVTNNLPSYDVQVATNVNTLQLSLDFDVQTKTITDTTWTSTGAGANVKAYIDSGATGNYTLIPNSSQLLIAGTTYTIDVRSLLQAGANRVKITFESENDDTVATSVVYSITLSEMYIEEFSNTWYNAIVEGESTNYKLGGFKIVGALSKTLHVEIYQGSSKVLQFEKLIGVASYVDTPYIFTSDEGLDLHELSTGIYICKAYLTSGNLESLPVSYNFMYVAENDKLTAQLVCVNNIASKAFNYSTNILCNYAIYNAGFSTGTPHILIQLWSGSTPTTKVDNDYAGTTTGEVHTLEYTIEWLIESTINLYAYFNITMGQSSQVQSIPIDNSSVYPAESGAEFYLNATTRSNNDSNKTKIINEATTPTSEIQATWTDMAWVDGIDGWTVDEQGRKALLIPAASSCTIPYQVMQGDNMTFEINFKVANVSDYSENIITIAENPLLPGFKGIRIRPTNITIHSGADINASNDIIRSKAFEDETTVHLLVTIQNAFGGNTGKNLVTLYINGSKALQFDYANGVSWEHNGNIVLGSSSADLYIYSCRVYRKVLGVKQAEQNYINSLRTLSDREAAYAWFNSILNENTHELLYEKVVNSSYNYNFFVIEMKDGATVPSRANSWAKDTKGYSDFEMHYGAHPEWDFKLFNVETSGQGTTSMDYYRWNIRWRIDKSNDDKKIPVAYYDAPTIGLDGKKIYNIQSSSLAKTVYFDGGANGSTQKHPALMRITAKTNFASSMQSHKIGATLAYTALHDAIGLRNEAQTYADSNSLPRPTVAVYEYPAFGFSRTVSQMGVPTYEFIGLFTIGPDKGDKPTFGYNIHDDIKNNLITAEGTDHSRRMAKFQYPWNSEVEYRASNECINIVLGNNSFDNGWEVGNCHGLSTDKASDQAAIETVLQTEFKPAYDVAWENSTQIFPIALNDTTYGGANAAAVLANINADSENFRVAQYNTRFSNADMEFWIEGEYVLYHYDIVTGQYESGINLVTQNGSPSGSTLAEKNEWFKTKRRERFLAEAPDYWDIQDCAYHFAFCLAVGATDNFAKNSYPYKMKTLANGGRWKWRQDDLDTIFDTDNRGSDSKPYYIEFEDAENGSVVFAGSTSVFWNLLYEVFWNDYGVNKGIESIGKDVVYAMANLGGGANTYSGIINFFKKYFWSNAQEFFPQSAYNIDAAWKYETAWLTNGQAVAPLTQSLGRHLEAEHLWCSRRAIYMMSLFKAGAFAQYSDTSLGQITFRPQSLASITVTPMMWIYPALANGAGSPEATQRVQEGNSYTFVGPFGTDGQTTFYIQASNYLTSVGDWKDLQLANSYVDNIDIVGSKLRTFKIGDNTQTVTTNVPSLSFNNTKCLEEIDARNASSLTGTLDLSVCTRLKRAYLEGTNIPQVTLPSGSKIRTLHLSDATTAILLKNLKFLTDLDLPTDVSGIQTLQIENCTHQDTFGILSQLFNANDAALQYIRIIWTDPADADATDITMLATIAANEKKDGTSITYRGINAQGNIEGAPVIEGTINMTTGLYTNDLAPLGVTSTEDWPGGLKRAVCSTFGTLYIIYDPTKIYINFADSTVETIALRDWSSDGYGVTLLDAASVTSLTGKFKNNTNITEFDELQYFTGITTAGEAFRGCTALKHAIFAGAITSNGANYNQYIFNGCSELERLGWYGSATYDLAYSFVGCNKLTRLDILSVEQWMRTPVGNINASYQYHPFDASGGGRIYINNVELTTLNIPSTITSVGGNFRKCLGLTTVNLHSGVTTLNKYAFDNCINLTTVTGLSNVTTIGDGVFRGDTSFTGTISLPNLTGTLGEYSFMNTGITSVTSLGSITTVSRGAFQSCTSLVSVNIPSTTTWLSALAFSGCTSLESLGNDWMSSVTRIGGGTFENCENLVIDELNLPNLTTFNEGSSFSNCKKLKKVVNLGTVPSIGNAGAFNGCTALTEVTLSANIITIPNNTFGGCTSLMKVHVPSLANWLNITMPGEYATPYRASTATNKGLWINNVLQTDIIIPSGIAEIKTCAFYNMDAITSITIPNTVTSIGAQAFRGCSNITSLTIPSSVTSITSDVFSGAGNGSGTLNIKGNLTDTTNSSVCNFKIAIIEGNVTKTSNYSLVVGEYIEKVIIHGSYSCTNTSGWFLYAGSGVKAKINYIEVGGNIDIPSSGTTSFLTSYGSFTTAPDTMLHFGYNGVVSATPAKILTAKTNKQTNGNVTRIYVGDGSSESHDNTILTQYKNNSNWSDYVNCGKVDTWYNYINALPNGYTRLEYVQTNSSAYLNTGINGNNDNLKITVSFSFTTANTGGNVFSNYSSENDNCWRIYRSSGQAVYVTTNRKAGSSTQLSGLGPDSWNRWTSTITLSLGQANQDGTVSSVGTTAGTTNTNEIILGTNPQHTAIDMGLRIYYFKVYDGNTLIMDLIPCLDSNDIPGFYDTVSGTFKGSSSLVAFTAGPVETRGLSS